MLQTVNIQLVLMKKPRFAEKNIYYREKATNFLKVFLLHTTQRHLLFGLWEVGCQNIYNFDLFGFQLLPDPQGEVKPKTAVAIGNFFFSFSLLKLHHFQYREVEMPKGTLIMEHPVCSVYTEVTLQKQQKICAQKNFSSKMLQNMLFFMCNNNKLCTSKLAEHLTKPNSEFRQIPNNFKLFKMNKGFSPFFSFLSKMKNK